MLRQQRLALSVTRCAVGPLRMSTDAMPVKNSRSDTPNSFRVLPFSAASQPSSDRTWNASHGITFASSRESKPSPKSSDRFCELPSQETGSQKDTLPWIESHTQQHRIPQDDNHEGFTHAISARQPTDLPEPQSESATTDPSSNGDGESSGSIHSEGCTYMDNQTFRSPLGYHIPDTKLRNAMLAEPFTTASYWHFSLYQGPGGDKDKVKVHYCRNKENTEKVAQLFLSEQVIGFDIEWKANASIHDGITNNVSLIQIASEERVLLAHIAQYPNAAGSEREQLMDDFVAPSLKKIMESPFINKVGVGIKADCTRMRRHLGIHSQGLFELSHLYKLVKYSSGNVKEINKKMVSLAQQVQEHLKLPLEKGEVRVSDWSHDLNYEQTQYAASDSYAALQLFHILEAKRKALEPTPPRPAHADLNLPIQFLAVRSFDESLDSFEDDSTDAQSRPATSVDELAQDFQAVAIKERVSDPRSRMPSNAPSAAPSKTDPAPEIVAANVWVAEYLKCRPATIKTKPAKAQLRAYYLWGVGEQSFMGPDAIAALLRVELSTVAVYVLQAIRYERFGFEEKRARALVPLTPKFMRDDYEAMISKRLKGRDDDVVKAEGGQPSV